MLQQILLQNILGFSLEDIRERTIEDLTAIAILPVVEEVRDRIEQDAARENHHRKIMPVHF